MYFWSQIPKLHKMDKQLYLNRTIEEVITEASTTFAKTKRKKITYMSTFEKNIN